MDLSALTFGSSCRATAPGRMAPRIRRWPVTAALSRSSCSRMRCAWALARETLRRWRARRCRWRSCRGAPVRRAAHRRCTSSGTSTPRASSTARQCASACATVESPLTRGRAHTLGHRPGFEQLLHAAVYEPQSGLEPQDGLTDDGESEVPRFRSIRRGRARPESRTPRSPPTVTNGEPARRLELRHGAGVGTHPDTSLRPVRVANHPTRPRMAHRTDPAEIAHLALEAAQRKGQVRQRSDGRIRLRNNAFQLHTTIRPTGENR